jgi:hypothetical protein
MKNVYGDGVRITNTYTGEVLEKGKDYMVDMVAGTISINRLGTFDISAPTHCPEYRTINKPKRVADWKQKRYGRGIQTMKKTVVVRVVATT